jgi:hypothetical protein
LSSHVPTYVDSCLGIVGAIALPGIEVGNCWGCVVWDVSVKHVGEHFLGEVMVEFLDLFPNVMQEGVAGPATTHHDEENLATPRYITIAAPEWIECVPILLAAMWRVSSPIAETASPNVFVMCLDVMFLMRSYFQMAGTRVSSLAPG